MPGDALIGARARLAARLSALGGDGLRIALAVSGGPDSLALLALAAGAAPGRIHCATVDHGLRTEAADEAAMVATLCARLGVPHRTLAINLAPGSAVQARARDARYAVLAAWMREEGLDALVTAHHADDQAETLVMRLNRGAGLRGLAAMRPAATVPGAPSIPLLRPLLDWRRAELAELCRAAGIVPAQDPSNRDREYERVRVREGLSGADWIDSAGLAASASRLAEADDALEWAVDVEWRDVAQRPLEISYSPRAPRAVRMRVLERIVAVIGSGNPRGSEIARWLDSLESGETATLAGVRAEGRESTWRFTKAPPHRANPATDHQQR
ncbi:tRNA lysidine(34) synthetase TilS [Novosphingobium sp. ZN18A2]|uniref:tRNA lysidine(34) synthetase TilS n=1 Tax=Novosphingobium sp. ZN18A2 TaxID=3079861 RepID=UPI0030D3CAAE